VAQETKKIFHQHLSHHSTPQADTLQPTFNQPQYSYKNEDTIKLAKKTN